MTEKEMRKALKTQWNERKREMGLVLISVSGTARFVFASHDIPSEINSRRFQLSAGLASSKDLQKLYDSLGPDEVSFSAVEHLDPKGLEDFEIESKLDRMLSAFLEKNPSVVELKR